MSVNEIANQIKHLKSRLKSKQKVALGNLKKDGKLDDQKSEEKKKKTVKTPEDASKSKLSPQFKAIDVPQKLQSGSPITSDHDDGDGNAKGEDEESERQKEGKILKDKRSTNKGNSKAEFDESDEDKEN